jgi:hypothetical protein
VVIRHSAGGGRGGGGDRGARRGAMVGGAMTNRAGALAATRSYTPPVPVAVGAEIMAFHLESTVVLLFEAGVSLEPSLQPDMEVLLGQPIARPTAG